MEAKTDRDFLVHGLNYPGETKVSTGGCMFGNNFGGRPIVSPSQLGRLDLALYGDLLNRFGGSGPLTVEHIARLTGASVNDVRAAFHDARNDSGVRPMKPYSNE